MQGAKRFVSGKEGTRTLAKLMKKCIIKVIVTRTVLLLSETRVGVGLKQNRYLLEGIEAMMALKSVLAVNYIIIIIIIII